MPDAGGFEAPDRAASNDDVRPEQPVPQPHADQPPAVGHPPAVDDLLKAHQKGAQPPHHRDELIDFRLLVPEPTSVGEEMKACMENDASVASINKLQNTTPGGTASSSFWQETRLLGNKQGVSNGNVVFGPIFPHASGVDHNGILTTYRRNGAAHMSALEDLNMTYGCRTTHIFCRPDCPPGRRTKPENRVVFPCTAAAITKGYRPCLVCLPMDGSAGPWKPKRERLA